MTIFYRLAVVIGMAAIIVAGAVFSAKAAPVPTGVAAVGSSVAGGAINVQWRYYRGGRYWGPYRRGWGWGWPGYVAAGVATGAVIGAAAATPYYGPPAYYAPPPVAYGGPQPVPGSPVRQCWVDTDSSRNYGYWRPC